MRHPLAELALRFRLLATTAAVATTFIAAQSSPNGQGAGRIAFYSDRDGDTEIFVMEPDGSNQRPLTDNSVEDRDPVWSPDGRHLAFISRRDGNPEIYVVSAGGGPVRRLTNHSDGDYSPAWSPDGKQIAFVSERDGSGNIYVVNADGTNLRRLNDDTSGDARPEWSPDGRSLLFLSARAGAGNDGAGEIFTVGARGGAAALVTQKKRGVLFATWSPKGNRIAFAMSGGKRLEIGVIAPDGSEEQNLTAPAGADADSQPSWSPDGRRLAFVGDRDRRGLTGIHVMNADGTAARRVSAPDQHGLAPISWSPDGAHVTYSAFHDGNWEIFTAAIDGAIRRLTTNKAMDLGVTWSAAARAGR